MSAQAGYMYPLADPTSYDNDEGTGFGYAAIPHDSGDVSQFYVFDVWIVDQDGNPHPGYEANPVPIRPEDLDLTASKPAPELPERTQFCMSNW